MAIEKVLVVSIGNILRKLNESVYKTLIASIDDY